MKLDINANLETSLIMETPVVVGSTVTIINIEGGTILVEGSIGY